MDLGLSGRRALVCASSKGLGRACALALAREGAIVTINGRNEETLAEVVGEIKALSGAEVTAVAADVSTPDGQAKILAACPEPDILVNNNAGPPHRDFRELTRDNMIEGLTMNLITPFEMIKQVLDHMVAQKFGRIVNITSSAVLAPLEGLELSSAARAGLTALVSSIARAVAEDNVTINCLLPGAFKTDRLTQIFDFNAEQSGKPASHFEAQRLAGIPANRFGTPEEFGQACTYLCSVQAGYITGQNLLLDGGALRRAF